MMHFLDYYWKEGKPAGFHPISSETPNSFRIICDPYKKRFSVEQYAGGRFAKLIYDSNLFDFRLLKKMDEAWQRELLEETEKSVRSLIRSIDERVILIEEAHFEGSFCRSCDLFSPQQILVARQKILHQSLGDDFDGVVLYDILDHPILVKKYAKDPTSGEFTTLLEEVY